jgi:hypothetical protein
MAAETPEQGLNARLRRVDWRFLLPSPRPRRALCRAAGSLADAVASIADQVVTDGSGRDCDLVVATDPDAATLVELREALAPGGSCYTEWHPSIGGVGKVERALRAAGFEDVVCYRPWPASGTTPVFWIPVGAPGASTYVRSRQRLRGGRVRRLLAEARRRGRDFLRGRLGTPICSRGARARRLPASSPHRPGCARGGRRGDSAARPTSCRLCS